MWILVFIFIFWGLPLIAEGILLLFGLIMITLWEIIEKIINGIKDFLKRIRGV